MKCRVCQGILVYLNQTTQPSESEDDERSVRDGMVTPRFAAAPRPLHAPLLRLDSYRRRRHSENSAGSKRHSSVEVARTVRGDRVGLRVTIYHDTEPRKHHFLSRHLTPTDAFGRLRIQWIVCRIIVMRRHDHARPFGHFDGFLDFVTQLPIEIEFRAEHRLFPAIWIDQAIGHICSGICTITWCTTDGSPGRISIDVTQVSSLNGFGMKNDW